ncbi:MAG: DNA polymerase III subunit delta [Acidobacteriota bacterium]|jgi:DNA polymerase-3 subunit delta|nr:DNA polymerase III subunit delta [Acidobacteriota bacterium]
MASQTIQTIEALERDLDAGVRPVYLVLGPEEYLRDQALRLLKKRVMEGGSVEFDCSEFAAGDAPVAEMLHAANVFPMLSPRRLVLVEDVDRFDGRKGGAAGGKGEGDGDEEGEADLSPKEKKAAAELEALLDGLQSIPPRSTVILTAMDLDRRKRLYKAFQKGFCLCEFPKLKDAALQRWAEDFVRRSGYRMSGASIKRVVEMAGTDVRTLASELEKLTLYAGEKKTIPDAVIADLVRTSRQQTIFNLTDAVGRRDRDGALKALDNLLGMGEHPLMVVTMLARQCRQMLIAIEGVRRRKNPRDIAAAAQIPPFKMDEFLRQARASAADPSAAEAVEGMFLRLASIDKRLKSSSLDGRVLLEGLIVEFV